MNTQLVLIEQKLDRLLSTSEKKFSHAEAAKYLDVSESYLYQLTAAGKVGHFKSAGGIPKPDKDGDVPVNPTGKKLTYLQSQLDAWLLAHRVPSKDEIDERAANIVVNGNGGAK